MEAQVAGTYSLSQLPHNAGGHPPRSAFSAAPFSRAVFSSSLKKKRGSRNWSVSLSSPFMGARSTRLFKSQPFGIASAQGRRREEHGPTRRAAPSLRASLLRDDHYFGDSDSDDEDEFLQWLQELARRSRQEREQERRRSEDIEEGHNNAPPIFSSLPSALFRKTEPTAITPPWVPAQPEPPDCVGQIVPASVEKNASRVDLPLSLRIIKEKKKKEKQQSDGPVVQDAAGESAWYISLQKAFSSMVFMISQLQGYALSLREELFDENLQRTFGRVQREMNSSFVWLFERIFSRTPALMVSVMLFLADFTVRSLSSNAAAIQSTNSPPSTAESAATSLLQVHRHDQEEQWKDVGGKGGGKVNMAAFGFTNGGRWEDWRALPIIALSKAPPIDFDVEELEAAERAWEAMVEEARKMKSREMDETLTNPEILRWMVAPVLMGTESEEAALYLQEEARYEEAIYADPNNALLLANFAQFIYLFIRDHDRAELYFKKAVAISKPAADPMTLSRYATFLWRVRGDLEGAEEAYQEAISAGGGKSNYIADYCNFLWETGCVESCCLYPEDHPDLDYNFD